MHVDVEHIVIHGRDAKSIGTTQKEEKSFLAGLKRSASLPLERHVPTLVSIAISEATSEAIHE